MLSLILVMVVAQVDTAKPAIPEVFKADDRRFTQGGTPLDAATDWLDAVNSADRDWILHFIAPPFGETLSKDRRAFNEALGRWMGKGCAVAKGAKATVEADSGRTIFALSCDMKKSAPRHLILREYGLVQVHPEGKGKTSVRKWLVENFMTP
jgi:hypothetical protein